MFSAMMESMNREAKRKSVAKKMLKINEILAEGKITFGSPRLDAMCPTREKSRVDKKIAGNGEWAAVGEREGTLGGGASAPRSASARRVTFSGKPATCNDSTEFPAGHDKPRWAVDPKWIVHRKCNRWLWIGPRKVMPKVRVRSVVCPCGMEAEGVRHAAITRNEENKNAKERLGAMGAGKPISGERSAKKRGYDERTEGNEIVNERSGQLMCKKARRMSAPIMAPSDLSARWTYGIWV